MNVWKLRAVMGERGITQYQLAKAIGCGNNTFSDKMNGRRDFKLGEVKRICEVLAITEPAQIVEIFLE